jgi:hypothetical protein
MRLRRIYWYNVIYLINLYKDDEDLPIDGDDASLLAVGGHAVRSETVGDVGRAIVTSLDQKQNSDSINFLGNSFRGHDYMSLWQKLELDSLM